MDGSGNLHFIRERSIMRKLLLLVSLLIFGVASVAVGKVSTKVCLADGNTPFEPVDINMPIIKYPDIMVGTELTIFVWSDINEPWGFDGGSLVIEEQYWDYGILSAREPKVGEDWAGSHFPAAGNEAVVWKCEEPGIDGFYLYSGSTGIEAGDWFVIDYNSISVGDCDVVFYDYNINWDVPVRYLSFSHVPTRDFNNDTKVDFRDYVILASYWQEANCNDPNWCEEIDLDINGSIDVNDLMLFYKYWLARTDGN